jgi:hypothetical protein
LVCWTILPAAHLRDHQYSPIPARENALQGYTRNARYNRTMESDQLNLIENSLHDLAARSAELRRYL